jgi:hypothetical protein
MITNRELLVFSVSHFNMYIEDANNKPSNKIKSLYNSLRRLLRDEVGKSMSEIQKLSESLYHKISEALGHKEVDANILTISVGCVALLYERGYFTKHDKEVDLMWNIYNHLEKNIGVQSMSTANNLIKEIA